MKKFIKSFAMTLGIVLIPIGFISCASETSNTQISDDGSAYENQEISAEQQNTQTTKINNVSSAIAKINNNQDSGYVLTDLENQLKSTQLYELITTSNSSSFTSENPDDYTNYQKELLNNYRPKTEAYYNTFINKNILFSYNQSNTFFQAVYNANSTSENTTNSMSETDWINYWYYINSLLIDFETYTEAFLIYPYLRTSTEIDLLFTIAINGLTWYLFFNEQNITYLNTSWNFYIYFNNYQELANNSSSKLIQSVSNSQGSASNA